MPTENRLVDQLSLTPNLLSISRLLSAPLFGFIFFSEGWWPIPAAFIILSLAQTTDYWDGRIARSTGQVSDYGKLLDPLADFIFYMTVFACFVWLGIIPGWMYGLIISREIFMNFILRPFIKRRGIILAARLSGKIKTAVQGTVASLILLFLFLENQGVSGAGLFGGLCYWMMALVVVCSLGSLGEYLWDLKSCLNR
ncbi:MAG: CDP-alcohol phosphatidyltransferase family protein [bacterium]